MTQTLRHALAAGLALLAGSALAQTTARPDSLALTASVAAANQQYAQKIKPESVLYNGAEYVSYLSPGTKGHQFFETTTPLTGTIRYRDADFQAVPLSYDLVRDQVVMYYPGQVATVKLVSEKVAFFTLGSHQFVRLAADSATQRELTTGFYELLLAGPVNLLARRSKQVVQTHVQQVLALEIRQTDELFVRTATTTARVSNLKNLVALLPTHQADVQRYARLQGLRFNAAQREASALAALRYYYTLAR